MGAGASTDSIPDILDIEAARVHSGLKFSEKMFNENMDKNGQMTKTLFLSLDTQVNAVDPGTGDPLLGGGDPEKDRTDAEDTAKLDMKQAEDNGVDWKVCHSCVRWNKPLSEIGGIITTPFHANSVDTKNGNYPIHIAAQNGHVDIVKWLVENGARLDVQNGTGQTPLHMAISYDYADVSTYLRSKKCNEEIKNWSGFPGKFGIDGDKDPADPMFMLESCKTTAQALSALTALQEKVELDKSVFDKAKIAIMGMQVKKGGKSLEKGLWDEECVKKFTGIMGLL